MIIRKDTVNRVALYLAIVILVCGTLVAFGVLPSDELVLYLLACYGIGAFASQVALAVFPKPTSAPDKARGEDGDAG
ncbi:hypothetical protein [Streptomyces sp. S1]|uniref:hypothetical protein n=1 Tax=Streptomyces sp. S1 TaxID=718288 RepID=UPI003D72D9C4